MCTIDDGAGEFDEQVASINPVVDNDASCAYKNHIYGRQSEYAAAHCMATIK